MRAATGVVVAAALLLTGCSAGAGGSADASRSTDAPPSTSASVSLPPAGAIPDYQLGGAYEPSPSVGIVVRDRTAAPAAGRYSICYINAFQTQPGESSQWPDELVLHDAAGAPVMDPAWPDEALLDTSTPDRRDAIAAIVGPWIVGCAASGFDAVEFDNLDSASRADGLLTDDDDQALAAILVRQAHDAGLAAAQKNAPDRSATLRGQAGFDFAIAEECAAFDECAAYTAVYGEHVLDVEYDIEGFTAACADAATPRSVVLRDRRLTTPDNPDFVFAVC